jgi:hypothetical protein
MRRAFASIVLLVLGVVHLAPLLVMVQFHVDRAYIERELCVQREVMAEMRTCHGECQLSKRFRILERSAEQGFPMKRIASRFEPKVPLMAEPTLLVQAPLKVLHPEMEAPLVDRTVPTAEPVPWC